MSDIKPTETKEYDDGWQFFYDGWTMVVPKDVKKTEKAALILANKEYKAWLENQPKTD